MNNSKTIITELDFNLLRTLKILGVIVQMEINKYGYISVIKVIKGKITYISRTFEISNGIIINGTTPILFEDIQKISYNIPENNNKLIQLVL